MRQYQKHEKNTEKLRSEKTKTPFDYFINFCTVEHILGVEGRIGAEYNIITVDNSN